MHAIKIIIVILTIFIGKLTYCANIVPVHDYGDYVLNCIDIVNNKRESRPFLKPYKPDPQLQEQAELIVLEMATLSHKGHLTRRQRGTQYNFSPIARGEGIGYRGSKDFTGNGFITCFLYARNYTYAGAAMAIDRQGTTYYCLLVK